VLVAAAVCPHPPLLVPEATGAAGAGQGHDPRERLAQPGQQSSRSRPELPELLAAGDADLEVTTLRHAAAAAVSRLLAAGPDVVVVVGAAERSGTYPADAAGSLRPYGVPFVTGTGEPVLPLALTVGAWLLRACEASGNGRVAGLLLQGVRRELLPAGCLELGARLAGLAPSVGMLVMGDGPARRAAGQVGAADPTADAYDKELEAAFAAADADRLAALDPVSDAELMVAGRAAWQVLAGAARERDNSGAGELRGQLLYAGTPLEVSYLVATWMSAD
jgi:hypothetical protein